MLADRIAVVVAYLEAVTRGEARADPETMRGIAALLGSLLGSAEGGEGAAGEGEGEGEGEEGEVRKEGLRGEFMTVRRRFLRVPAVRGSPRGRQALTARRCDAASQEYNDVLLTTYLATLTKQLQTANNVRRCSLSVSLSSPSSPLDTLTPPAPPRPRASPASRPH